MVTKGIITSIDFNGNTCQVRIPLFETAGNDPITGTAIVSNTPGSYNGYKVGDVVLVAFEDGKMQNPVIVGKLYLGAAKEKQDPRGTINVETTTASKSASLPADAVLTANVDSNVPNTNTPFGSLASIANNLNSLNTDVNQLDRFTRNQFNSVITDVNDQGEQLRSEIKQTADNIENKVVHKHQNGSQNALGWNLDEKEWKINAQDTVNGAVKDINIVTIDRNGMSIAGDLKLNGYPKNTTVLYVQTDNDTDQPQLYEFTNLGTSADKTWYYGKYIKIEEKYVLIFKENFEYYEKQGQLALGATIAYRREIASGWSTTVPERTDGKYIWQWTHTEIYSFDEVNNIWNEEDNDKVVCITGAKGEKGDQGDAGKDGYSTATIMLYKRSNTGVPEVNWGDAKETAYTFSSKTLSVVPTDWKYTIADAGNASDGELYCIAAIASSNTDTDTIAVKEFGNPILYAKNGEPTVTLSIENDFDSVPCDSDGNPSYSDSEWKTKTSHTIKVFEGQDQQQFSVIADSSDKQIPSTEYAVVYKPDDSITYHVDTTDKTFFTAYITGLTADSANVLYTLYKNGIAIDEARFTATKLKAGAPGDPAVDYDILFSSSTIKVSKTGDKTPRTINVNFKKTVGQAEPENFSGKYKVFVDNGTEPISQGTASSIILATSGAADQQIDVSSAKSNVIIELYTADGNTKLEGETIDVVADGTDGTSVAQLILYKRSTEIPSGPASDGKWTYNAAEGSLTCENQETKWKTDIPSGTEPCYESHAAVLVTGLGTTTVTTWSKPAKFVENGKPGIGITSLKTYYLLQDPTSDKPKEPDPNKEVGSDSKWKETPDAYIDGYVYWLTTQTIYSDGRISYSDPVKDNGLDGVYEIAQGKSKNYYSETDPAGSETAKAKMRQGDGWFDTAYHKINKPTTSTGYLQKYIKEPNTEKYILITSQNIAEYISGSDPAKWPDAYSGPTLYQWSANGDAGQWKDVGGELITNKVTANYINALDITAKKITVLQDNSKESNDSNPILFQADGTSNNSGVKIGGFYVTKDALVGGRINTQNYCKLNILDTFKVGETDNKISSSSLVIEDPTWAQNCYDYYKDNAGKYGKITWEIPKYDENAGTQSQQCLYNGLTTYKCNGDNALKNEEAGNPIISCMVLKPDKALIEAKVKEALDIKDGEPIPTVTFSTTLNLGISSPSYIDSTIDNNYDYIIASTPFSFADLGIEIGPDVTNKDQFIQDKIEKAIKKIVDLNVAKTNVDNQGKHKLITGIFTGDGKIQEYARATGPRSIGSLENLTKVIYPSLTTDHYIAIFMVNIQKTCFKAADDIPIYDYDSSGNITGLSNKTTDSTGSNYILPTYGYCCVSNSVEVALQTLEIGTNFKVKTDGTMFANNAFFTGTLNVPETAVIGGFNISKNTLTSSTLNIDSNKVTISSFKPLVLGSNFKLISAPDTISTQDDSGEEITQKIWKSKISSRNQLEILGESSILLSNTIDSEPTNNASISLKAKTEAVTTSGSQEIRVVTTLGTELSPRPRPGFDSSTTPVNTYVTNNNIHNNYVHDALIDSIAGTVPISYFTRATITATVYSNSGSTTAVEAKDAYKITVYYKFGATWSSTTLAIPEGKTSASTTVSELSTSTYPTYYGISKNSSSEAAIAGADNNPPLKYTVYYKNSDISYTPEITANGTLTVKGDIITTKALTVKGDIKTTSGNVYGSAFYASSDRELKTNIENINLDSNLDKFYQQLQPVKFNFKTDLNAKHFGFIAQDLKEALSIISTDNAVYSIVNKDDKTGYYRVNYNEMVALNAAQIKNIMSYIKDLQSQYEALKLKYKELEEKINENG